MNMNFLATGIGSLPFDCTRAIEMIMRTTPNIPYWPQLPKYGFEENMYVQFSYNIPGVIVDIENKRLYLDQTQPIDLEPFYRNYLQKNLEYFSYDIKYFRGFHMFLDKISRFKSNVQAVKGQVTGPISLGLQLCDIDKKPILYNDTYIEILVKNLCMKAKYQEKMLKNVCSNVILCVDEPYLGQIGSGYLSLNKDNVIIYLNEIFHELRCMKGFHCCANTDWSLITKLSVDIIFFDAYNDARSFFLYKNDIKNFISNGGTIAWGIVPNTLQEELSIDVILHKLDEIFNDLKTMGISISDILSQSLVTPSCGLGSLSENDAQTILEMLHRISCIVRNKYGIL